MGRRKLTTPTRAVRFQSELSRTDKSALHLQGTLKNLAASAPTLAIYDDYEKAFDRVWHMGLLVKLFRMDLPIALLKMIHSWLWGSNRLHLHCLPQWSSCTSRGTLSTIATYSSTWKQPINVDKTVAHVSYNQVTKPVVNISMLGEKIQTVDSFEYLGFTWTSKLKWLRRTSFLSLLL